MNRNGILALLAAALLLSLASPAVAKPTSDIRVAKVTARLDGGAVRVTTKVKLKGKVKSFAIAYKLDKVTLGQKKLARGKKSQTVRFRLPPGTRPGAHKLTVCADPRKKVRERNERNNCRTATIGVPGAPIPSPPTPTPTGDHTAPDTVITGGPPAFAFHSTETGSTFQCRLDGGAFAACTSPHTVTAGPGGHEFAVRAIDRAGNVDATPATHEWSVSGGDGPGGGPTDPPADNPATEAPTLPSTGTTTMADATSFLYTGADPIQKGVDAGAIAEQRVAVLRGRVLNRMGGGVGGVRITVLDHPELGRTSTRADGGFDIAVNGGGTVTLRYERAGWVPAQRTVEAPWQDYASVEDVVMIPYDDAVTTIDLDSGEGIQVHRSSATTDADGTRRATVMFSAGTHAEMTLKDGSKQPLDQLDVRATEYTVGDTGRAAMPGALPPASGYTYAVELSVDQAVEAGATDVRFDKPVVTYVDNFLDFPVGGVVPIGYYDREHGRWEASENGRVVKIVGETNGRADVDIDGDGTADDGAALGITDDERSRLADLYDPGKSLWRVAVTHFTPWDCNWPFAPPADSVPPPIPVPNQDQPNKLKPKKECIGLGSIIGCQGQRLGQSVALTGTPYNLRYWSDRTPGYKDQNALNTPLIPAKVPSGLQKVFLTVDVAGRHFEKTYDPSPGLESEFVWDGKDAYGRNVVGTAPATVKVGYQYGLVPYSEPKGVVNTFGRLSASGNQIEGARNRMDLIVWSEHRDDVETVLGGFDARAQGLGGWTLDVNHLYDARTHTVHLGSGGHINADPIITTAAGNGNAPSFPRQGDGQDGPNAPLGEPYEAEVGPDGTVYFTEVTQTNSGSLVGAVRKIDPDGHVRTLATGLGGTIGLGVADDGTVYVAESTQRRVQRITPDGVVHPFAGGGTATGEGIPAASAKLNYPSDVAVSSDGRVYIAENVLGGIGTIDHGIVREVGPDGLMTTVAGGGSPDDGVGDGGPATQARLESGAGIALGQSGELLIAETHRIRRVDAGGTITTIAGGGAPEHGDGDGGPATDATIAGSFAVDVASDGGVLFTDNGRVRRVALDGTITTLAGGGSCGPSVKCDIGDKGPAPQAVLPGGPGGVAAAPDGSFYITTGGDEGHSGRIRKVTRPLTRTDGGRGVVPATDGSEAYEFDDRGRHLKTLDGLTGATLLSFAFDAAGRVAKVTDGDGNATIIERGPDGKPVAVVAPGGQRTQLEVNDDGWLDKVVSPAGETTRFQYRPDGLGLMAKLIDTSDEVHEFGYTGNGRLTTDKDPDTGVQTLDMTAIDNGYRVTRTSALGRTRTYAVQRTNEGGTRMEQTTPTGARTVVVTDNDGSQHITYPDGTKVDLGREPDPQWGFSAPMISSYKVTTPDGKVDESTMTRSVTLASNDDPLSVTAMTETVKSGTKTTKTVYDAAAHTLTSTSPKGRVSTTTLDDQARMAGMAAAGQDTIAVERDAQGRLKTVKQGAQSWTYEYDARGRVRARTDAAGKRTEYGYDDADRLTSLKKPSGHVYGFAYDKAGNQKSVTMPDGDVHEVGHNGVGQLERFLPAGATQAQTRAYDKDHDLKSTKLASGRTIMDGREAATGRVTGQGYAEAAVAYGFKDATERVTSIVSDPVAAGPDEGLAYEYDGDMPKSVTATGSAPGRYEYGYGAGLLMNSIKLVSGSTTLDTPITRDDDGLVTGLGTFTFTRTNNDANLRIAESTFAEDMAFDGQHRLAARTFKVGAQTPYKVDLTRNARGQIERRVETVGATTTEYLYTYDDDARLTTVKRDGTVVEEYGYDANGNRTTRRLNGGAVENLGYDGEERLASRGGVNYAFDADGFLSSRGADTFVYSARGELLEATVGGTKVTYTYDGLGRRVSRTVGTSTTQYLYGNPSDPFQVTAVRDAAGVLTVYYYDEAGHLLAMRRGTTRFYIATDQVGTPRVVTATNGTVSKTIAYDTFGNATSDSAPAFELPFGFAGGLSDSVTGLVRFGLRDYEPASGRWTARDPALFGGGQANLYEYVGSDPVAQRDPTGLFCVGGSVYAGFGGGGQLCINDDGFSLCAEAGFGVGSDLSADTGGLAEDTESIIAEAGASAGPIGVKVGAEFDNTGCLSISDPEVRLGESAFAKIKDGKVKFGYKQKLDIKNGPDALLKMGKVKVQAKVAAKFCRKALW